MTCAGGWPMSSSLTVVQSEYQRERERGRSGYTVSSILNFRFCPTTRAFYCFCFLQGICPPVASDFRHHYSPMHYNSITDRSIAHRLGSIAQRSVLKKDESFELFFFLWGLIQTCRVDGRLLPAEARRQTGGTKTQRRWHQHHGACNGFLTLGCRAGPGLD